MRNNKSPLTIPQALKIYTGAGFLPNVLLITLYECLFFLGTIAGLTFVVSLSEGMTFIDAITDISTTPAYDIVMPFMPALINCLVILGRTDRNAPGGKFFRTLKGGIDTFVRSRIGIYICLSISLLIFSGFVLTLNAVGIIKTQNGILTVAAMLLSVILSLGAGTFALLFRNDFLRGIMATILCIALPIACDTLLLMSAQLGAAPPAFTAAGIIAAGLLALSFRIYLSYHEKNLWNN